MYLFFLFNFLVVLFCEQGSSELEGTYFTTNNNVVYKDEVILVIPRMSLVQCLLRCKTHNTCHDVAMDNNKQCVLLRDGGGNSPRKVEESMNLTRTSPISVRPLQIEEMVVDRANVSSNETAGDKSKGDNICDHKLTNEESAKRVEGKFSNDEIVCLFLRHLSHFHGDIIYVCNNDNI